MNLVSRYRLAFSFVFIAFGLATVFYRQLPFLIPLHWDIHDQPGLYAPKWWAVWITPIATAIVISGLAWLLPAKRTSTTILNAVAGLMCYVCAISLFATLHPADSPFPYVAMGAGVYLMVVGNILGKLTWNFFVGIRTYWTMDDPNVWDRTHRAAGPVYVLGGAAIFLASLTHASTLIVLSLLLATILYPVIYSYMSFCRNFTEIDS